MQFINILGAATLTGVGVGSLAGSAILWKRAGVDLKAIAAMIQVLPSI
jgi:hypothetical protein